MHSGIVESFFLIFSGAALLATAALFTRQPLLVAYIAIGCLLGPHGMAWVADPLLRRILHGIRVQPREGQAVPVPVQVQVRGEHASHSDRDEGRFIFRALP